MRLVGYVGAVKSCVGGARSKAASLFFGAAVPLNFLPLNNNVLAPAKTLDAPCVHQEGVQRINANGNVRCTAKIDSKNFVRIPCKFVKCVYNSKCAISGLDLEQQQEVI